jgi:hypothetical protein
MASPTCGHPSGQLRRLGARGTIEEYDEAFFGDRPRGDHRVRLFGKRIAAGQ